MVYERAISNSMQTHHAPDLPSVCFPFPDDHKTAGVRRRSGRLRVVVKFVQAHFHSTVILYRIHFNTPFNYFACYFAADVFTRGFYKSRLRRHQSALVVIKLQAVGNQCRIFIQVGFTRIVIPEKQAVEAYDGIEQRAVIRHIIFREAVGVFFCGAAGQAKQQQQGKPFHAIQIRAQNTAFPVGEYFPRTAPKSRSVDYICLAK